jgi:hypothetical protein
LTKQERSQADTWALATSRKHSGKINARSDVCEWIKRVMELRAAGKSGASFLQMAAELSNPDTEPYLEVTEAGVRHHCTNKLRDLVNRVRSNG